MLKLKMAKENKNKISRDFWILVNVVSLVLIIGIVANPSNLSSTGKFFVGMLFGMGLACMVIALIILIRDLRKK
jgi:uncharacterized membrane protein